MSPDAVSAPALELARRVLAGREVWVVGGLVRDAALARLGGASATGGRQGHGAPAERAPGAAGDPDLDLVVGEDAAAVAHALAAGARAASFRLSEDAGSWRVLARDGSWQIDVEPLRGGTLEEDLRLRDFTVNAVAESLDGSRTFDPLGGLKDLSERRLRMAAPGAFAADPLRALRLVRLAIALALEPEEETLRSAAEAAAALGGVSQERVFAELRAIVDGSDPLGGLALMERIGATAAVLPELEALRGVEQSRFHHRDVLGHTLEVLQQTVELTDGVLAPAAEPPLTDGGESRSAAAREGAGASAAALLGAEGIRQTAALLREPLADGLTRAGALRWGALLHDAAKPLTRGVGPGGRVTFAGHDARGAELAGALLGRLRASGRLRGHVAALVLGHLRLGFLVHERQPLGRRTVYGYLRACEGVEVDVTLLSVADRLATRGERSQEATAAHLELARAMLVDALAWRRAGGPPAPLWRGDELAEELAIERGPALGGLLEELRVARYAGEVTSREQALEHARRCSIH